MLAMFGGKKAGMPVFGKAPEITAISGWLNSKPLSIARLRGKVVLVHFWAFGCGNCVNASPHMNELYKKYEGSDFVMIGVHTPEFDSEKDADALRAAVKRMKITYPVAADNDYSTWNSYGNRYWPADYLIDKNGNVRYKHVGEGDYDVLDAALRELIG